MSEGASRYIKKNSRKPATQDKPKRNRIRQKPLSVCAKQCFDDEEEAMRKIEYGIWDTAKRKTYGELSAYECSRCGAWHIGHSKRLLNEGDD